MSARANDAVSRAFPSCEEPTPRGLPPPCVCARQPTTRGLLSVSACVLTAQVMGFYFTDAWNIADTVNYTMLLLTLYSAG